MHQTQSKTTYFVNKCRQLQAIKLNIIAQKWKTLIWYQESKTYGRQLYTL